MMLGYARTSTVEQEAGLEDQIRRLRELGCERVFSEKVSSVGVRPQWDALLASLRKGDVVVVTKLDRAFRSMRGLVDTVENIKRAGATLRVLDIGLDTGAGATANLIIGILGQVASWEREMMLERQRIGIAKAKEQGKYKGRKAKFTVARARTLRDQGHSLAAIARELGVSKQAVAKRLQAP